MNLILVINVVMLLLVNLIDYDHDTNIRPKIKDSFNNFDKNYPNWLDTDFYNNNLTINIRNAF